jgi:hypothetical protein
VAVEQVEHRPALLRLEAHDVMGEVLVDEKQLAAAHRMAGDHRMNRLRIGPVAHLLQGRAEIVPVAHHARMQRAQAVEEGPHRLRERLIRSVHVGEEGVAAARRHLVQAEDAADRGLRVAGDVRVPQVARIGLGVRIGAHLDDPRMAGHIALRVDVERAEVCREVAQGFFAQRLIAEEQHQVFGPGVVQLRAGLRVERPSEVEAANLGADQRRHGLEGKGGRCHGGP